MALEPFQASRGRCVQEFRIERWIAQYGNETAIEIARASMRPPERYIRVGTAVVSQTLCGGVFVSGLPPDRVFAAVEKRRRASPARSAAARSRAACCR